MKKTYIYEQNEMMTHIFHALTFFSVESEVLWVECVYVLFNEDATIREEPETTTSSTCILILYFFPLIYT